MELLLSFVTSLGVTGSALSLIWLWKRQQLKSPYGVFGTAIFAFAVWHFLTMHNFTDITLIYKLITGFFALAAVIANTWCVDYKHINIGVDRRKSSKAIHQFERRQTPAKTLHIKRN